MKRTLYSILVLVGAAIGLLATTQSAEAQFFGFGFGFGGFFQPRNNVVVVNNNGGFGNQSFVNVRSRGFLFPRNDITVVNNSGFSGGFVNRGFGSRAVIVSQPAFIRRRVVVGSAFNSCDEVLVVRARAGCF
ncbi:MAG: hypothetical protein QXZ57_07230 [Nitrososphaerota archaeon]